MAMDPPVLSFDDVLRARRRIGQVIPRTPTRRALKLEELLGAREIWLKLDNLQRTGSFKERGALNALLRLPSGAGEGGVVTASAGNHAQALAYHGARLGRPVTVVMPRTTPHVKVEGARRFGANVVLHGDRFDDAMAEARRRAEDGSVTLVHPFDDAVVAAGQGTALLELLEDAPSVEVVPIPVGGGGLICGSLAAAEGVRSAGGPAVDVVAVEPTMYPSLRAALTGEGDAKVGGDTIAEGVAVKSVGALAKSLVAGVLRPEDLLTVSEDAIEEAIVRLALSEKTVAEGAGACGLAALFQHPERFEGRIVGILICGGNIDARLMGQVFARHLVRAGRRARIRVECTDQPGRLAHITTILHESGANVIDVLHDRLAVDVPAKETVIDLIVETEDAETMDCVVGRLQEAGFPGARLLLGRR